MNILDERVIGESDEKKSQNSRTYMEVLIGIYEDEQSRAPLRVKAILAGVTPDKDKLPHHHLHHISQLNPRHTRELIEMLTKKEDLPHRLTLILQALQAHQSGTNIISLPILNKSK
ncbi:hypothetical protein K2X92_02030 [Candidatus Gracilibacteria bacterium]|nr:hypothetical protein [Candidatus Gracilibacteria bacterium]